MCRTPTVDRSSFECGVGFKVTSSPRTRSRMSGPVRPQTPRRLAAESAGSPHEAPAPLRCRRQLVRVLVSSLRQLVSVLHRCLPRRLRVRVLSTTFTVLPILRCLLQQLRALANSLRAAVAFLRCLPRRLQVAGSSLRADRELPATQRPQRKVSDNVTKVAAVRRRTRQLPLQEWESSPIKARAHHRCRLPQLQVPASKPTKGAVHRQTRRLPHLAQASRPIRVAAALQCRQRPPVVQGRESCPVAARRQCLLQQHQAAEHCYRDIPQPVHRRCSPQPAVDSERSKLHSTRRPRIDHENSMRQRRRKGDRNRRLALVTAHHPGM